MDVKTTKPISTISFNTTEFLRLKLQELTKAGIISFWSFILHEPEDDEAGKKQHHHLYVEPAKLLQTDDLKAALLEPDPEHDKPRGCLVWCSSSFPDWYLYGKHDSAYLAMKGQSRKYEYRFEAFSASDDDDFLFHVKSIDMTQLTPFQAMREAQDMGLTYEEYFALGRVPMQQVVLMEKAWQMLMRANTFRAGREGHPDDIPVDPSTGAVL